MLIIVLMRKRTNIINTRSSHMFSTMNKMAGIFFFELGYLPRGLLSICQVCKTVRRTFVRSELRFYVWTALNGVRKLTIRARFFAFILAVCGGDTYMAGLWREEKCT